ncbi:MAG: hypothetical protein GQ574_21930 [Crocinitomix sp.]|nr:hypothetical protein [Crocinitomix sp.]
MKKLNITKNAKLLLLGAAALLFSTTQAAAQTQDNGCVNSGADASAIGLRTAATGSQAFSSGYYTTASGSQSTVFGYRSVATGYQSFSAGHWSSAIGRYSFALGARAVTGSGGTHAMALGIDVRANANRSMTFGAGIGNGALNAIQNNIPYSLMIGFNSTIPSLFVGPSSGAGTTGRVAIGTVNTPTTIGGQNISAYRLFVAGGILTEEVRVRTGWADYVFADGYELPTLTEVGEFIDENGHLPNVPSAAQVEEEGIEIGEITRIQQEKIEELTLYMIEMQKEIEALKVRLEAQEN